MLTGTKTKDKNLRTSFCVLEIFNDSYYNIKMILLNCLNLWLYGQQGQATYLESALFFCKINIISPPFRDLLDTALI